MNTTRSRHARAGLYFLPFAACAVLIAAAPPRSETPEDLIRQANDAFRAHDTDTADTLYSLAEEQATDPGLVAFNRGAVLFDRKRYSEAEAHYERVLKDAACPPERAAKAWYNRGTCLLHRGGSVEVYRAAVACFEHALDSAAADGPLKERARDNLELAKLLWNDERKKSKETEKKSPNEDIPREESDRSKPQPENRGGAGDTEPGSEPNPNTGAVPKSGAQPQQRPNGAKPAETDKTVAGNNAGLQPLEDRSEVQQLSETHARANLAETARRIKREQQSLLRTLYGPDRPTVRDW